MYVQNNCYKTVFNDGYLDMYIDTVNKIKIPTVSKDSHEVAVIDLDNGSEILHYVDFITVNGSNVELKTMNKTYVFHVNDIDGRGFIDSTDSIEIKSN